MSLDAPINLDHILFTAAGSYLAIEREATGRGSQRAVYKTRSGRAVTRRDAAEWSHDFFEIVLLSNNTEVPYRVTGYPTHLVLEAASGASASFAFADVDTLSFIATNVTVCLVARKDLHLHYADRPGHLRVADPRAHGVHQFRAAAETRIKWRTSRSRAVFNGYQGAFYVEFSGTGKIAGAFRFDEKGSSWTEPLVNFKSAFQGRKQEYSRWMARIPQVPKPYSRAAIEAWTLLHLNRVSPRGHITRETIYSNKGGMTGIWTWDNCFHALAVAEADPVLAFQQVRLPFDHQTTEGQVPDKFDDGAVHYGYTKPPISGWTVSKLMTVLGLEATRDAVSDLYEPIRLQTEWWFRFRDADKDGLCAYLHGNDSGWDNSTVFDQGQPTQGADLAAHLVLQMEALSRMAKVLGRRSAARQWQERSDAHLEKLLEKNLHRSRFFSPLEGKKRAAPSKSLLNYIPILLGGRLPKTIIGRMAKDLSPGGPFLTDHGLSSEALSSSKYEADGYWRGPIWSPPQYLIVEGLRHARLHSLARTISTLHCELCSKAPGMWENYDASTGKGQRTPSISWTASIFLLLANSLYNETLSML
jgi:putative isomerase